jgi:VanZ family protein
MPMTDKIKYSLPAMAVMAGIFALSQQSAVPHLDIAFEISDKILHFIAYFVLGASYILSFIYIRPEISKKCLFMAILIAGAVYGASDEIHQYFVIGRDSDIYDWVADILGSCSSFLLYPSITKWKIKNEKTI